MSYITQSQAHFNEAALLCIAARHAQFAEPRAGSNEYRFRIGDYRAIFEVLHDTLWVTAIKRRDEAYW